MSHWELEKANYPDDDGAIIDWFDIVKKYVVPGMLVLAVLGVIIVTMGGTGTGDMGLGSIFQELGKSMFDFGAF